MRTEEQIKAELLKEIGDSANGVIARAISNDEAIVLARILKSPASSHLTSLTLNGNSLSLRGLQALADATNVNRSLTTFNIQGEPDALDMLEDQEHPGQRDAIIKTIAGNIRHNQEASRRSAESIDKTSKTKPKQ